MAVNHFIVCTTVPYPIVNRTAISNTRRCLQHNISYITYVIASYHTIEGLYIIYYNVSHVARHRDATLSLAASTALAY